ncbi:glycosyltransferase [Mucilaginibacter flavus]|uniref:glycosyltransferase n=1 Tax=Mucilaginibacter flavus TaxID=931504 RepID=UPI0025B2DFEA|nr:glycosyltransferase [Mucilaginibacter flavus]MDN3583740.1 glycosyltransferase [Mucilaginibacter flavus]
MGKMFIVYYDFKHTSGNHAGMSYLVKYLEQNLTEVKLIKNIPQQFPGGGKLSKIHAVFLAFYIKLMANRSDKVFFFEYLTKGFANQDLTAKILRKLGAENEIYALVHLPGDNLTELYKNESTIIKKINQVDKVMVFGSSLKLFLEKIGYKKEIVNTFHYVDTEYYKAREIAPVNKKLNIVCIGNLKRNYQLMQQIVANIPVVQFHICMGSAQLKDIFDKFTNVNLYGFLEEKDLLSLMQRCDIGLSVLEDTVGSNVITTSMATGLVQVVSDVGSIRDYCDEHNSILCSTLDDFITGIKLLEKDREKLSLMKKNALKHASKFSMQSFLDDFKLLLY